MKPLLILIVLLGFAPNATADPKPRNAPAAASFAEKREHTSVQQKPFWNRTRVNTAKAITASFGAGLLLWGVALRRLGHPDKLHRFRDGLLIALGLASVLGWSNFGRFHSFGFEHPAEFYHYFLGSKYFRELGYTRLYACTAVADAAGGAVAANTTRSIRDLETNEVVSIRTILENPKRCIRHFSPERWQSFRSDVDFFRGRVAPIRWNRAQLDHGYNGTPVWGIAGTLLANTGPATPARIRLLALLDPALLMTMWGFVAWAFGWRTLCVALIYWGTSYTSQFGWNGGGFLRQGWLATSVISICLVRRKHPFAAGIVLAYSVLLRIFPVVILSAIALKAVREMLRWRRIDLSPDHRKLALGGLLATCVLLGTAAATSGGVQTWLEFAKNSRLHLSTPLLNHVGLQTLVSYDHSERAERSRDASLPDSMANWKQARRDTLERRRILHVLLVICFVGLLSRSIGSAEDWVVLVLGIGAIPVMTELSGYYHSILLGLGLLWVRRESIGVAVCGFSALIWGITEVVGNLEEIHVWTSLATVLLVCYTTFAFRNDPGLTAPTESELASPGR